MSPQATNEKQLMKIADVARRLNVGRSMVYELIRHGDLTPIHIGRAVRFEASAVDKLIENLAAASAATRQPMNRPEAASSSMGRRPAITLRGRRVWLTWARDAGTVAEEVVQHLSGIVGAKVSITVEVEAEIPDGASDQVVRTVTENARTLKFTNFGFEES